MLVEIRGESVQRGAWDVGGKLVPFTEGDDYLWYLRCPQCGVEPTSEDIERRSFATSLRGSTDILPWTIGGWVNVSGTWLCGWRCVEAYAHTYIDRAGAGVAY